MAFFLEKGGHLSAVSRSLSACQSWNSQWCQAFIKCWQLTFRIKTFILLFLTKSGSCLQWFCCACPNGIPQKAATLCNKNSKPVCSMPSLYFYFHKCVSEVLSGGCLSLGVRGEGEVAPFSVCHGARNVLVTFSKARGEEAPCAWLRLLLLDSQLAAHPFSLSLWALLMCSIRILTGGRAVIRLTSHARRSRLSSHMHVNAAIYHQLSITLLM